MRLRASFVAWVIVLAQRLEIQSCLLMATTLLVKRKHGSPAWPHGPGRPLRGYINRPD
jgi:hypothetical protein